MQDVVSKLTHDYFWKIFRLAELLENFLLNTFWSFFNTYFDKLRRVLILWKLYKISFHFIKNLFICLIIKTLKNFGDNKVPEFILNIRQRILQNFTNNDLLRIFIFCKLNKFFHDTQTLFMLCQLFKIFTDDIKNVLSFILLKRRNDLLNHVLSFVIHRKSANVIIFLKVLFDQFEFFCLGNRSNDGLKAPSAFFVARDINEVLAFYLF